MPDGFDEDQDSSDAQREAVVELANLTNGMIGGIFDGARDASRPRGSSRPHSTSIRRVRVISGVAAVILALLTVASPVVLGLTVGLRWGATVGLGIAAAAAGIVFVSSHAAERRVIIRRTAREEG